MNYSQIFTILGLGINTAASLIMLSPYLSVVKNIDDDFIVESDEKSGKYSQKKHFKNRKLGLIGFGLFTFGFIIQIIGVLLTYEK